MLHHYSTTNLTENSTLESTLVAVKNRNVALKRDAGSVTAIPLDKLSVADQQVVRELVGQHNEILLND